MLIKIKEDESDSGLQEYYKVKAVTKYKCLLYGQESHINIMFNHTDK